MKAISSNPKPAALVGFLFVLPFLMMNAIVGNKIEPFFSFIRPGIHTGPFEYVWLAVVLLLIPIGAFIAIRPMFHKGINGKRKFYLLNLVIAIILLTGFVAISVGLGTDIYLCDVLQIPNCD